MVQVLRCSLTLRQASALGVPSGWLIVQPSNPTPPQPTGTWSALAKLRYTLYASVDVAQVHRHHHKHHRHQHVAIHEYKSAMKALRRRSPIGEVAMHTNGGLMSECSRVLSLGAFIDGARVSHTQQLARFGGDGRNSRRELEQHTLYSYKFN